MTNSPQKPRCRLASTSIDISSIIDLSHRVQNTLTASGSQQVIGPLPQDAVESAVSRKHCFVLTIPPEHHVSVTDNIDPNTRSPHENETDSVQCPSEEEETIIGTLLFKPLSISHFARTSSFDLERYPPPWYFLGSVMLAPEYQRSGSGLGEGFVREAVARFCARRKGRSGYDDMVDDAVVVITTETAAAKGTTAASVMTTAGGEAAGAVRTAGGTILLDCWAGADKLRAFYLRCGFQFAAIVPQEDYEIAIFTYAV